MTQISAFVIKHPSTYLAVAPVIALNALTTAPPLFGIVALLTALRLHVYTFLPRGKAASHGVAQVVLLSLAATVTHMRASWNALSTGPTLSITILGCLSALTAAVGLFTITLEYRANRILRSSSSWSQLTLFPAIWASVWGAVAYLSPVGRLITWSPVVGLGPYSWIRPYFGQWGIDWVVAAWVVICANAIGDWLVGSALSDPEDAPQEQQQIISFASDNIPAGTPIAKNPRQTSLSHRHASLSLAAFLIALALPSYLMSTFPLPTTDTLTTTSLSVACVLPDPRRSGIPTGAPTLEDFRAETRGLESSADILLWPEGAIRFESASDREKVLHSISSSMPHGKIYGISFEDVTLDGTEKGVRRNGIALVTFEGVVLEYYKRKLVPIAESFSLTASSDPPSIYTMNVTKPKRWSSNTAWSSLPGYIRPVSLTTSICLDFSSSSSFDTFETRPALILAPARTWHTSVGYAMWEQARARAEELGSIVLWCDGGAGGVSGVAGGGMHEYMQVGRGSWVRRISFKWPFDQGRTFFSLGGGGYAPLVAAWGIVGMGSGAEVLLLRLHGSNVRARVTSKVYAIGAIIRAWRLRPKRDEERPLLD